MPGELRPGQGPPGQVPGEGMSLVRLRSRKKATPGGLSTAGSYFKRDGKGVPGGPAAKTVHSQCRGPGLDPELQNYIPQATT